jgi:hypothetical protein
MFRESTLREKYDRWEVSISERPQPSRGSRLTLAW